MWSSALRLSSKAIKPQIIAPVRTIMTCTNPPSLNNRRQGYAPMVYQQKRTFMGPVIRIVTQFLASLGGTSIRAFFQAFQQAAAQADAGENAPQAPAQEFSLRKGISIPESLQILDLKREDVNSTTLSEKFDRYFEANDPSKGGSFYLQSKVYRAHEALLEELEQFGYIRDETAKVTPQPTPAENGDAESEGEKKEEASS